MSSGKKGGTIVDHENFDAKQDCEVLHKAMKGMGTDEQSIIDVIAYRSNKQRQELLKQYAQMWGKDLIDALKSELGGNFEDVVVQLFKKPDEYDAWCMHDAMSGLGTTESTLIEILSSRSNSEIKATVAAFKRLYKKDLAEELKSETSGSFKHLLFSLAQGSRSDEVNGDQALEDAQALFDVGEKEWGTDESRFNVVFASRSFQQLNLMFDKYEVLLLTAEPVELNKKECKCTKKGKCPDLMHLIKGPNIHAETCNEAYYVSKKTTEEAMRGEMSGDVLNGMLALVECARNVQDYFAHRLYRTMKGAGTNDEALIRIMISRSEVDLEGIKEHFQVKYGGSTLEQYISGDCKGDYKNLLIALCRGNRR